MTGVNQYGQPIGPAVPNWTKRMLPDHTPMQGRYTRLEPLSAAHAADLYSAFQQSADGRAYTYLFDERAESLDEMRNRLTAFAASTDPLHHAVIDLKTGRAVGHAALMRMDPIHGVIEVGHITLSPLAQQTRMATEMIYLFLHRAFQELGYRRFEWKCDALNAPSRRAAERFGFQFEGIFRQAVVYKNRSRDTAWFSIIDAEWPTLARGYEDWLAPDNFDESGQQRRRLADCRRIVLPSA